MNAKIRIVVAYFEECLLMWQVIFCFMIPSGRMRESQWLNDDEYILIFAFDEHLGMNIWFKDEQLLNESG